MAESGPPEGQSNEVRIKKRGLVRTVEQNPVSYVCRWCGELVSEWRWPSKRPMVGPACREAQKRWYDACRYAARSGKPEPAKSVSTRCSEAKENLLRYYAPEALYPTLAGAPRPQPTVTLLVTGDAAKRAAAIDLLKARLGDLLEGPADESGGSVVGVALTLQLPRPEAFSSPIAHVEGIGEKEPLIIAAADRAVVDPAVPSDEATPGPTHVPDVRSPEASS